MAKYSQFNEQLSLLQHDTAAHPDRRMAAKLQQAALVAPYIVVLLFCCLLVHCFFLLPQSVRKCTSVGALAMLQQCWIAT